MVVRVAWRARVAAAARREHLRAARRRASRRPRAARHARPRVLVPAPAARATSPRSRTASSGSRPARSSRPTSACASTPTFDGDVAALFAHAMPQLEPAYGACFLTPWGGIASLSPELFLRRDGRAVTTGPIKGTRAARPAIPAALARSEKDRAEHVMIVDLMRNDLGRVAEYGSVEAPVAPRRSRIRASGTSSPRSVPGSRPATATPRCCARPSRPARSPARPRSRR